MNSKISILALFIFISLSCKAQLPNQPSNDALTDFEQKLIGTWVAEGTSFEDRWVIENNYTLKEYDADDFTTYNWVANEGSAPSGVPFNTLEITNVDNPNDTYNYEINTLTNDKMILVYQRSGGLGGLMTYHKQ